MKQRYEKLMERVAEIQNESGDHKFACDLLLISEISRLNENIEHILNVAKKFEGVMFKTPAEEKAP